MRKHVQDAAVKKDVKQLIEHFREELTGSKDILIADAYEKSLEKPKKRIPSESLIRSKRSYWLDFTAFLNERYPDLQKLSEVRPLHAEAYIQYLRQNGRFNKTVTYRGTVITQERSYQLKSELSPKTINTYQQVLTEVFQLLARDAGIIENPFASIPMLKKESESREAFSEEELAIIRDNLDDFTRPLFTIAIATALREGDICTLKWAEIDFKRDLIIKRMRKTGNMVEIPIMPPLRVYLSQLQTDSAEAEYVLPKHAEMYLNNSSGVSYRIKQFLENKCHIATTKTLEGRSRAVSVKDLHSCRHTFCYYAGLYGIPLSIVQSIVGHMTPEMTKHYSAHASLSAKREQMRQLPEFMMLTGLETRDDESADREELHRLISTLPIEKVRELLEELR
ncbi:MAG: hypothetical protein E7041_08435 [Lentisphaerae bacterium]|nr:hypothetical protein [Lentisphaerota bacterium]